MVCMNWRSIIEVSSSFFYVLTRQVVNECQRNRLFFFLIGKNLSPFSYSSNCVGILCLLILFIWLFYRHKVLFPRDSILWNNLQLTVIFNRLKMYLQIRWITFDSLSGSSVSEKLNKSSSMCGFLSFL